MLAVDSTPSSPSTSTIPHMSASELKWTVHLLWCWTLLEISQGCGALIILRLFSLMSSWDLENTWSLLSRLDPPKERRSFGFTALVMRQN